MSILRTCPRRPRQAGAAVIYYGMQLQLIQDRNLLVERTVPVRLKRRGMTVHRKAMLPDPHFYQIQPGLWVAHPALIHALEEPQP